MKNTQVFTALVAIAFILIVGLVIRYTGAADVTTTAEIQNEPPTINTRRFATTPFNADDLTSTGILPSVGNTRTIHINGLIQDNNGKTDIATSTISLTFHRTTKGNTCTTDQNDCYRTTTCTFDYTLTSETELAYNCPLDLSYYIDATDPAGAYKDDNWTAEVTLADQAGSPATLTATIEVNSLLALNLPDGIDYGTRSLGEQSSSTTNVETPLTQRGNTRADVFVSGGTMDCSANGGLGSLATNAQKWSLTDIDYTATTSIALTASDTKTNRNIRLRTDDQNESSKNLYWNIAIPQSGVKGLCTGANTILITARPPVLDNESWVDTGAVLPGVISHSQSATIGGYVYLFGGLIAASSTNVIYRAPTENPTAWVDTGATLPVALYASQIEIIDNYVYLFGGDISSVGSTAAIYRAPLSNPLAWVDTGATLPGATSHAQTAIVGSKVYLFGGRGGGTPLDVIYSADVSGPLTWAYDGQSIPSTLWASQSAVIGDYVFLFGGLASSSVYTNAIYRAPVVLPTAWVDTGATIPVAMSHSELAVVGDYVYLLGGYNGSRVNTIQRAPVADPLVWEIAPETLPIAISMSQPVVIDEYLYLLGGNYNTGTLNTIYRAFIE